MTRDELIWIGIRVAGLYALLKALFALPYAVVYLITASSLDGYSELKISVLGPALSGCANVLVYAIVGSYLVFKGDGVFRLLAKTGSTTADQ